MPNPGRAFPGGNLMPHRDNVAAIRAAGGALRFGFRHGERPRSDLPDASLISLHGRPARPPALQRTLPRTSRPRKGVFLPWLFSAVGLDAPVEVRIEDADVGRRADAEMPGIRRPEWPPVAP